MEVALRVSVATDPVSFKELIRVEYLKLVPPLILMASCLPIDPEPVSRVY
jgi:hypothetical protein